MYKEVIEKKRPEMEKVLEHFRQELQQLRTGRASTSLVENILVEYYGSKSPLKQIASISTPEARVILISPWDRSILVNVEKAISESQLNLNPNNDGQAIRINIPELTEERRRELVKLLNQKMEDAKIAVRRHREEAWEEIQELEKSGKMGEDGKFAGKEKLQELVDEHNKKIEEIRNKKEEEIMKI